MSVQLPSLAVLPSWNQLFYALTANKCQMLVDWLFSANRYDEPGRHCVHERRSADSDFAGKRCAGRQHYPQQRHCARTAGSGRVVSLNLPSDRIASGMYVNLYSGANLASRAVVSDLDTTTVRATVTDVFAPGTYLRENFGHRPLHRPGRRRRPRCGHSSPGSEPLWESRAAQLRPARPRHVERSYLRISTGSPIIALPIRSKSRCGLAILPGEEEGRIYCFRRISLTGIPERGSRQLWIDQVQRVTLGVAAAQAVHGSDTQARLG